MAARTDEIHLTLAGGGERAVRLAEVMGDVAVGNAIALRGGVRHILESVDAAYEVGAGAENQRLDRYAICVRIRPLFAEQS